MSEYEEVIVRLDKSNTIIEEIVRCKDCRWFDSGKNDSCEWHFCTRHLGIYPNFDADDFCSYGEREGE